MVGYSRMVKEVKEANEAREALVSLYGFSLAEVNALDRKSMYAILKAKGYVFTYANNHPTRAELNAPKTGKTV